MAAAAVISAVLLTLLRVRHQVPGPGAAAVWVAVAVWRELSAGRAPFTVGIAAALGCVVAADVSGPPCPFGRLLAVAALAQLTCLLSPVAAVFLGVVAAALAAARRWAEAVAIALAAGLPLGAMAVLSTAGGQPSTMQNCLPPLTPPRGGGVPLPPPRGLRRGGPSPP